MSRNLNKFYYRDYFSGISFSLQIESNERKVLTDKDGICMIEKRNQCILEMGNQAYLNEARKAFDSIKQNLKNLSITDFKLTVCYPGLVTGVGIGHEAKVEGEFKLGLHLDYTTGLPVVYGSSVKGILRSAFKVENLMKVLLAVAKEKSKKKEELEELKRIGQKLAKQPLEEWSAQIFGDDKKRDSRSAYNRDIFFDAIVCDVNHNGRFLASDSITPHGSNPLLNPTPITFVHIASGSQIMFRFRLIKTGDLTVRDKETLFKAILMTFGAGAKTNVGYGRLEEQRNDRMDDV